MEWKPKNIGASIKDLGKKWLGFSKMDILTPDELVGRINRLIPFFQHFGGNGLLALTIKNCHQNANFKVCSDGRFSLGINLFHGICRVDDPAIACQ